MILTNRKHYIRDHIRDNVFKIYFKSYINGRIVQIKERLRPKP